VASDAWLEPLRGSRILVTGGAGFLGSHLVRRLSAAGIPCTALVHAGPTPAPGGPHGAVAWVRRDLTVSQEVDALVAKVRPEIVFHLAAVVGGERSLDFADRVLRVNLVATHDLLRALGGPQPDVAGGVRRIVLVGSGEEYGRQESLPCTEELPARPVSPYSASKAATTQFALLYQRLFGLPVVVLRPFVVYGPGQRPGMMLPSLLRALVAGREFPLTAGEQTRDFVHVDDVIDCLLAAAGAGGVEGEIFNVCSGEERSIREVAEIAARLAGVDAAILRFGAVPYRDNEVWRLVGSNEKAGSILGWSPRVGLEEGLLRTLDAYRR
jgi:UDP-glucose 4-epimerase